MSNTESPEARIQSHNATTSLPNDDTAASEKKEGAPNLQYSPSKGQGDVDAHAMEFNPGWRFYLAFSSLLVITLMAALDATSLSVAIPRITKSLGGSAIEGFWSGTSFLLTSTGMFYVLNI